MSKNFHSTYKISDDPWGMNRISQQLRNNLFISSISERYFGIKFPILLDLAVGDGTLLNHLEFMFERAIIADAYSEMIKHAELKLSGDKILFSIINKLPEITIDKKCDIILLIEVLYYLSEEDLKLLAHNLSKVCEKETIILATLSDRDTEILENLFYIEKIATRYREFPPLLDYFYFFEKFLKVLGMKLSARDYTIGRIYYILLKPVTLVNSYFYTHKKLGNYFAYLGIRLKKRHKRSLFELRLKV